VEYKIDGISQIQVRDEIGLTFASGLRSVLRHDPDVVLIGEIRDAETAEIAVRAAQTGHLVLSTLHTNDSVSAVTRLLEMGIDPFLLGSSLVCSIAQRLAQRVCRHCMVEDQSIPDPVRQEMAEVLKIAPEEVRAWKGAGCVECNDKGYRGRVAIYEFFVVNEELADSFGPGMKTQQLRREAARYGWHSIRDMAWNKVREGIITVDEVQRLTRRIGAAPPLPDQDG
jgi:type IV pilus assembly protein PilB